jgi:hypothetical protein
MSLGAYVNAPTVILIHMLSVVSYLKQNTYNAFWMTYRKSSTLPKAVLSKQFL